MAPTEGVLLVVGTAAWGASGGTRLQASSISAAVNPFFSRKDLLAASEDPRTCGTKRNAVADSDCAVKGADLLLLLLCWWVHGGCQGPGGGACSDPV